MRVRIEGDEAKLNIKSGGLVASRAEFEYPIPVVDARELDLDACDIVFTAVESDAARELEPRFAKHRPVFSTASAFRYEEDVPIAVPGVNLEHLDVVVGVDVDEPGDDEQAGRIDPPAGGLGAATVSGTGTTPGRDGAGVPAARPARSAVRRCTASSMSSGA